MAEVLRIRVRADTVWQDSAGTTPAGVGDPVGRWEDPDRGISVTQDVTGNKPTLLQDANGHLYLSYDGADDIMTNASWLQAQPFSYIIVAQADQPNQIGFMGDAVNQGLYTDNTGDYRLRYGGNTDFSPGADTNLNVIAAVVDGASSQVYENGVAIGGPQNAGTAAWNELRVGGGPSGFRFAGKWYELAGFSHALNAAEVEQESSALLDYYSNPAGGGDPEPIDLSASITNAGQSPSGSASVEVAASGSLTNAGQTTSASVSVEASASGSAANAGQSVSGSAEVEVSASGALANAGQSPSGSASVEVSVSGTLTNAGQSVQGFIGEVPAQVSGAITNGGQSLSGTLTTEAALSAVVANGGQQISGSAAVEAAASASIENAGQVIASAASVAVSLSGSLTNAGQTITGRMVNGAVLVPSRITLSLESTHALSLSVESSHVLELSIE